MSQVHNDKEGPQVSHPVKNQQQDATSSNRENKTSTTSPKVDKESKKSHTSSASNEKSNGKQSAPGGHDPVQEDTRNGKKAHTDFDLTGSQHMQTKDKESLYLKTVKEWRPGNSRIVCPECGFEGLPIVRHQHTKACKSKLGAICMFGCWPLCFIPFILRPKHIVNLYCCRCVYYLGTYDMKKCQLIQ